MAQEIDGRWKPGAGLSFRAVSRQVLSLLTVFTVVFGMGTGVFRLRFSWDQERNSNNPKNELLYPASNRETFHAPVRFKYGTQTSDSPTHFITYLRIILFHG